MSFIHLQKNRTVINRTVIEEENFQEMLMSSMKRRIFMGKAKSGNSNVLKVVSIVAAIVVAVGIIAVFVAPLIPVRKVDESAYKKLDNNDVYERAYNIYGVQIYKDRDKALAQFKADYNAALVYLDEKLGLGEFNTSYDMLSQYGENGWQYTFSADERRELGEEKVNELKQKMAGISAFCDMYENTNWRYYVGLQ